MRETHHHNRDGYKPGNFWRVCDECGLDYRQSETRKRWDNMIVCNNCWEIRHPQEKLRGKTEKISVPDPRPKQEASFLSVGQITQDDL